MDHNVTMREGVTLSFTDDDIVNPDDYIPTGEYNPHNVRPFALTAYGTVIGIAFAGCESDAVDEIADSGKLDAYQIPDAEHDCGDDCEALHAGNAGEPFDQSYLRLFDLPNPKREFVWS